MDMKLARPPRPVSQPPPASSAKSALWPVDLLVILCFVMLPLFLVLSPGRPALSDVLQMGIRVAARHEDASKPSEPSNSPPDNRDILLGGLLSPDFDESACLSRYLSSLYRKPSPHTPSPYLVSRLRKYEELHGRCGPGTPLYDKSLRQLASAHRSMSLVECNYLVWTVGHLGDRVLSMASAFLDALLTYRVFLVHATEDMAGLFCEPFPGATWELPPGFPVQNLTRLRRGSDRSYGNLVGARKVRNDDPAAVRSESLPAYTYVHLEHDYRQPDQLFFCDGDQTVLGKVNWLILRSNLYFVLAPAAGICSSTVIGNDGDHAHVAHSLTHANSVDLN